MCQDYLVRIADAEATARACVNFAPKGEHYNATLSVVWDVLLAEDSLGCWKEAKAEVFREWEEAFGASPIAL